jgi:hypothetical protein
LTDSRDSEQVSREASLTFLRDPKVAENSSRGDDRYFGGARECRFCRRHLG